MGFQVLNRRAGRASGVAVAITKNPKAEAGRGLSGFFRIAPDVVKEAGWTPEDRVQILIGDGPDTGLFILQPSPEGKTKPFQPKNGASYQVSFSAMSAGFTDPMPTTEVEHSVNNEDRSITVTVPSLRQGVQKKGKKVA